MGPTARLLSGDRLHLQHGPSDLVIWAEGGREQAYQAAARRFQTVIAEIVEDLPALRQMLSPFSSRPNGAVAQRMHAACMPFVADDHVTRMAAVAGAVADEVLAAMRTGADMRRAYVNNGGDIAVHLASGAVFTTAMKGHDGSDLGRIEITSKDRIGGIATSGRHGRSLSLGIADSVTVLARSAAEADVAATLIANAVDLPDHPAITRRPAREIIEDSDLGDLPAVTGCGLLGAEACTTALRRGLARAQGYEGQNRITSAALFLQGHSTTLGAHLFPTAKDPLHVPA